MCYDVMCFKFLAGNIKGNFTIKFLVNHQLMNKVSNLGGGSEGRRL